MHPVLPVRTFDPEEADYFYVPQYSACFIFPMHAYADYPWFGPPGLCESLISSSLICRLSTHALHHLCVCVQSGGHVPLAGFKLPHVSIVRSGTCTSRSLPHHPGQAVDPEALPILGPERRPRPHMAFHSRRGRVLGTQRGHALHLAHTLGQVGV